jgi:hypothetical protein
VPSNEAEKESLKTTPWRRAGWSAEAGGIDLGETCGDAESGPRGTCDDTLLPTASGTLRFGSDGSGVTALTVCGNTPRRLLADGLSGPLCTGSSDSVGSVEARPGLSGRGGGALAPFGVLPRAYDLPSMAASGGLVSLRSFVNVRWSGTGLKDAGANGTP